MRAPSIAACLALALTPSIANAQSSQAGAAAGVDQIGARASAGHDASVSQIGRRNGTGAAAVMTSQPVPPTRPNEFSAPETTAYSTPAQINANADPAPLQTQLTFGPAVADAPSSPTNRAEGRNTTTQTLTGRDRCDPRGTPTANGVCREVIETRSAEFKAPDIQPLSPEQRLIVSQRDLAENSQDVGRATRRLANGDVDDTNAGMAIASIISASSTQGQDEEPARAQPSATDAIVAGIVASLGGQPPQ
jgi:hypothetical protein